MRYDQKGEVTNSPGLSRSGRQEKRGTNKILGSGVATDCETNAPR